MHRERWPAEGGCVCGFVRECVCFCDGECLLLRVCASARVFAVRKVVGTVEGLSPTLGGVTPIGLPCTGSTLCTGIGVWQCVHVCVQVFVCICAFLRPRVCPPHCSGIVPLAMGVVVGSDQLLSPTLGGWHPSVSFALGAPCAHGAVVRGSVCANVCVREHV
jgi:hypothetical protein